MTTIEEHKGFSMQPTYFGLTLNAWAVIGAIAAVLALLLGGLPIWFRYRDNRVILKATIVATQLAGRSTIKVPNRLTPKSQRIELHLTLTNKGASSIFLRSIALKNRDGNYRFAFLSKDSGIQELKPKAAFDSIVDIGQDWYDFDQIEPISSIELRACKAICQDDGFLEVKLADDQKVTFWAKDICKPNFFAWPDALANLIEHHKKNKEARRSNRPENRV